MEIEATRASRANDFYAMLVHDAPAFNKFDQDRAEIRLILHSHCVLPRIVWRRENILRARVNLYLTIPLDPFLGRGAVSFRVAAPFTGDSQRSAFS